MYRALTPSSEHFNWSYYDSLLSNQVRYLPTVHSCLFT
jgi:hypothetical protein